MVGRFFLGVFFFMVFFCEETLNEVLFFCVYDFSFPYCIGEISDNCNLLPGGTRGYFGCCLDKAIMAGYYDDDGKAL